MIRTRHLGLQTAGLIATLLLLNCAGAIPSAGQGQGPKLPQDCSAAAAIPLPPGAEAAPAPVTSPACASSRWYRGIGRPINYSKARACAWQERLAQQAELGQNPQDLTAPVVGGSLILADIYFNGAGVKRNIPLALRFACESEEGMANLALPDIEKLHGSAPTHEPFEFCDYAASTFMINYCEGYGTEIEDDRSGRYYKSLMPSMTEEQRAAFEKLLVAEKAYVAAHASEVYQGGTIRTVRTLVSQSILKELFQTEVVHFERKKWPALTDAQIKAADPLLRRELAKKLQETRTPTKDEIEDGAVTAEELSSVEGPWEGYRDAWVAFARLRYPSAVPAIRAQITLDRYRLVKTIGQDAPDV
jgi:hypothetical protein